MRARRRTLLGSGLGAAALWLAAPATADLVRHFVPNQAVIQIDPVLTTIEMVILETLFMYGVEVTVINEVVGHYLYQLSLPDEIDEKEFAIDIQVVTGVVAAEVNDESEAPTSVAGDTQPFFFLVTGPEYDTQYALGLIGLQPAHEISTGLGVTVAVLDTGADKTHPVLAPRTLEGYDFVDDDTDPDDAGNGQDDDLDDLIDEMVSHGTLVAGLIAKVAPEAEILPVRVLDSDGHSHVFRVVQGIYYAVDNDADIINMSLGTRHSNQFLADAVAYAREAGVLVVAAAGNDHHQYPVQMPAGDANAIGVAATGVLDYRSGFSNYGSWVAISAPGEDIVSTVPGGAYARASGTSFSTAIVSGSAALARVNDDLSPAPPDEIERRLCTTALSLDDLNPGYEGLLGAGRVNTASAVGVVMDAADLNQNGQVEIFDLLILIGDWGETDTNADIDGDGDVSIGDLLILLDSWG